MKKGISLIVLVITIIVMIILVASIVITLSNNGVITRASEAVKKTDISQIQNLATLAWADAYMSGKTTDGELESAVNIALKKELGENYKAEYNVVVTSGGVTVTHLGENTQPDAGGTNKELSAENLYGVWIFNEFIPDTESYEDTVYEVSFISNGEQYKGIILGLGDVDQIAYTPVPDTIYSTTVKKYSTWYNEAYRTVDFGTTGQEVSTEFYTWLTANAVLKNN